MVYTQLFKIDEFPFWSGAKNTIAEVKKAGKMDDLELLVEEFFANDTPTKTQINDYVWFNQHEIFLRLGIRR